MAYCLICKRSEGTSSKKATEEEDDDISGATMAEIMELMNHGVRKRPRKVSYVQLVQWRIHLV